MANKMEARRHEWCAAIIAERDALAAEVAAMSEWQPIETAPKDGTPVIIWQADGHHFEHRKSWRTTPSAPIKYFDDQRYAIGYWRPWGGWGNRNAADVRPTHWRPLPNPPQGDGP